MTDTQVSMPVSKLLDDDGFVVREWYDFFRELRDIVLDLAAEAEETP